MSYGLNMKALERLCNQLPTLTLEEAGTALADLANEPVFLEAVLKVAAIGQLR